MGKPTKPAPKPRSKPAAAEYLDRRKTQLKDKRLKSQIETDSERKLSQSEVTILKEKVGTERCLALAMRRKSEFLMELLAEVGVHIEDPDTKYEQVEQLCRIHQIPTDQTIDTHPELRCKRDAILGGTHCSQHSTPATRAQVKANMLSLLYPSIDRARKLVNHGRQEGAVVSLIKHIWDVNGFKPTDKLEIEMKDEGKGGVFPPGFDPTQLDNDELRTLITLMRKMQNKSLEVGRVIKVDAAEVQESGEGAGDGENVESTSLVRVNE